MSEKLDLSALQKSVKDAGAGWQAGPTSMTALPAEEQVRRLGYIPGPGEPSLAEREQAATANYAALKAGMMSLPRLLMQVSTISSRKCSGVSSILSCKRFP